MDPYNLAVTEDSGEWQRAVALLGTQDGQMLAAVLQGLRLDRTVHYNAFLIMTQRIRIPVLNLSLIAM